MTTINVPDHDTEVKGISTFILDMRADGMVEVVRPEPMSLDRETTKTRLKQAFADAHARRKWRRVIAKEIGVNESTVGSWASGESLPRDQAVWPRLAGALGKPLAYFGLADFLADGEPLGEPPDAASLREIIAALGSRVAALEDAIEGFPPADAVRPLPRAPDTPDADGHQDQARARGRGKRPT